MRINQIKNLCWLGNVAVFAGLAWAGLGFYGAWQQRAQPAPPAAWPDTTVKEHVPLWPPSIGKFKHIWEVYVNGEVPPPPPPPVAVKTVVDDSALFKAKVKFAGGIENRGTPMNSTVLLQVTGAAEDITLGIGGKFDGWRLESFRQDERLVDQLVFNKVVEGKSLTVVIEGPPPDNTVVSELSEPVNLEDPDYHIPRDSIPPDGQGWADSTSPDTYKIPYDEMAWHRKWGEEVYLPTLDLRPNEMPDGTVQGLKVFGRPGEGTPVQGSRGLVKDDVILSINGVPVGSREDVLAYLRGAGANLPEYVVILVRRGKEVAQTYKVARAQSQRQ